MTRAAPRLAALRLAALGVCALALSGCISLLPKSKPAQLYRFGEAVTAAPDTQTSPRSVGVYRANGIFQSESAGDRILTMTGGKASFIAQSRWVSPASMLFDQAVLEAFDADPGPVRLVSRGEPGKSDYALRVDVRNFETRYDNGPNAAPTVLVRVRVGLSRSDRTEVGVQILDARVPASENRVSAIVVAYDKAVREVLTKLVAWTEANARPAAA
jgi:cholesterol transport system auxiliary component